MAGLVGSDDLLSRLSLRGTAKAGISTAAMLEAEAQLAVSLARSRGFMDEDDTAVIFQSWTVLYEYVMHLQAAFNHFDAIHAIAIKTNPHKEVLKKLVTWGFGLEAASYEELLLAEAAGIQPCKLVFDGPVKRTKEIKKCNEKFPGLNININCLQELERFPIADECDLKIGIRINPMVDTGAPAVYHVSGDDSKFGVPISEKEAILGAILKYKITTLHVHAGSSMKYLEQSTLAVKKVVDLALEANSLLAQKCDRRITAIDMGGGLLPENLSEKAMAYTRLESAKQRFDLSKSGESVSTMHAYANMLRKEVPQLFTDFTLITEFGQWVHFNCGFAVSELEYLVPKKTKQVMYVHLGADYFMRDVYTGKKRDMRLQILGGDDCSFKGTLCPPSEGSDGALYDLAGPLCVAGDYLMKDLIFCGQNKGSSDGGSCNSSDKELPAEGDFMLTLGTGSNSYGMWSRHCSRTIPKVIGVSCMDLDVVNGEAEPSLSVLSPRWNPFVDGAA